MRLGFVTALADEARTLALPVHDTLNRGHHVEVAGVGIENANRAALKLLDSGVDGLVSWGTAGALDPRLGPGSVVIYDAVYTISGDRYACDSDWRAKLAHALSALGPITGSGFTSKHALATAVEKAAIRQQFDCIALDMESAAVASQAAAASIPFAAVRVIVDPEDFDIPRAALAGLELNSEPRVWPIIRGLIRRPHELPALLKLAHWYRISIANLTAAAEALQPEFGMD